MWLIKFGDVMFVDRAGEIVQRTFGVGAMQCRQPKAIFVSKSEHSLFKTVMWMLRSKHAYLSESLWPLFLVTQIG